MSDFKPVVPHPSSLIFPGAVVVGDVTLGENCSIWFNAVVRADEAPITIGDGTNIQDNATLHVSEDKPLSIGANVTVGHGAILHGCTVGDGALIGMGAVVLDDAVCSENAMVAAGALVTPRTVIPAGTLAVGSPAKTKRPLTNEEIAANRRNAEGYAARKEKYRG